MPADFPFQKIWYGVDLPDIRPIDATYGGEPFAQLPPVDPLHLDGSFRYLSKQVVQEIDEKVPEYVDKTFKPSGQADIFAPKPKWQKKLAAIQQSLPEHLILPEAMVRFMSAPEAQNLIPSCTACYFDLPDEALPFRFLGEDGYLFYFYRDQQDCLFWFYYVRNTGESCILVSPLPLGVEDLGEILKDELVHREVFYTAASFEEFIYRTWIENIIWFDIEEGETTDEQTKALCEAYLQHYQQSKS
ncbi:MAG: hypothetical protein HC913_10450 [Microscillaceae bacterium]|nr:hypothetical protein [Microscillaceae bacterium]